MYMYLIFRSEGNTHIPQEWLFLPQNSMTDYNYFPISDNSFDSWYHIAIQNAFLYPMDDPNDCFSWVE